MKLWDEKTLIEQKKNCSNCNVPGANDTMNVTSRVSTKNTWKDIGLTRKCPKCSGEILYKTVYGKRVGDRKNTSCKICQNAALSVANTGKRLTDATKKKLSIALKGRTFSKTTRAKIGIAKKQFYKNNPGFQSGEKNAMYGVKRVGKQNPNYGKKWSLEKKLEHHRRFSGKNAIWYGRKHTEATKRKKREIMLNHVDRLGGVGIGKKECQYLDSLSHKMGWHLRHAGNGGQFKVCGYSVDGYDEKLNIVVEYDEPRHYLPDGKLKPRDVKRMNEIKSELGCRFYRYDEKRDFFYECSQ